MKEKIKIASGQGFWGDLIDAPYHQITKGDVDYLVMDYLAEVTMSILQKQKNKNSYPKGKDPQHPYYAHVIAIYLVFSGRRSWQTDNR